jgi:hypothetical protein
MLVKFSGNWELLGKMIIISGVKIEGHNKEVSVGVQVDHYFEVGPF